MTALEAIQVKRAEEQVAGLRIGRYERERDSWDVLRSPVPVTAPTRRCLAGDCAKPGLHHGYCKGHWEKVSRSGVALDLDGVVGARQGRAA